ncbi:pterin-4-alpha-carbinolamine dehydratase [Gottschalkia purinilytica]|uniref:4a-hydroxytetrahydrobiopterin dehydratase n=1 Tax=Gottschalkia purinilytica TaxID=1503 RepID=A0A0L0WBW4_GOTPU|nr:4a-hydroxytetrahydrobiopterin dehydratase [Gottschalkia purinilytica]KNF08956.1 pterin-4-alpha-carbinolamine dehydratase [Gottschalkia purinilytica]
MKNDLENKKCEPCSLGTDSLKHDEIVSFMELLNKDWEVIDDVKIKRIFNFKDFKEALTFTNKIGDLAENEGHHPDIRLSWGKVVVYLTTHKIKGLSENDFIMAVKIDKL